MLLIDLCLAKVVHDCMKQHNYITRTADSRDLADINQVISTSVLAWPLAERVKRLALNVLLYDDMDLYHYEMLVIEKDKQIIAVIVWDQQTEEMLCHGLYVLPDYQSLGHGRRLLEVFYEAAERAGAESVVVKAERVSRNYFVKSGFELIPAEDINDYPYMYRKTLSHALI